MFLGTLVLAATASCGASRPQAKKPGEPVRASRPSMACTLAGPGALEPLSRTSSTVALARSAGRTLAFVSDEDAHRVIAVDLDSKKEIASVDLASPPAGIIATPSGRLAVTLPRQSVVQVIAFEDGALATGCAVPAPAEPVALAMTPDDRELLVVSAWGHKLTSYRVADLRESGRVDLPRDPRAVVVSEDGSKAFVAHAVGSVLSAVDLRSSGVYGVSLDALLPEHVRRQKESLAKAFDAKLKKLSPLDKRRTLDRIQAQLARVDRPERVSNQGFALALSVEPRGRVLVPDAFVDPGVPDQISRGYGRGAAAAATPAVAVIDASKLETEPRSVEPPAAWVSQDLVAGRQGCRLPRAAAVDAASGLLLVTCLGADVLVGYDAAAPSPIDAEALRVRVPAGPTGLGVDARNRRAVVFSQFDRVLTLVPLPKAGAPLSAEDPKPVRIALAPVSGRALSQKLDLGRRLFHMSDDPRIARDGRACASCHIGGRDDGLVWSTPNGPRRTKTLAALVEKTAPYSWDGSAETLRDQIEGTFDRLEARGTLKEHEVEALVAYVASLPPPPRAADAGDAELVEHGRRVFASAQAGCATCHAGAASTDRARHEVGSEADVDTTARFDTPSLSFLEGRAPYFHDGRYKTLRDLITGSDGKMGSTAHLTARELDALEAYLRTL